MGQRSRTAQPFPLWRLRSGPCATPINPNIRKRYSDHVPPARILGRLTSSRLVSSAHTAAFC